MANTPSEQQSGHANPQEQYSHGYEAAANSIARRTAAVEAAFLVPHLRPGMRVIDCGSGPGTITAGLARIVAPGEVFGIDIERNQVERSREHATEQHVSNVTFEVGSIYDIPASDESFDAAIAHTVLQHVSEPVRALKEIRRVLKPGGVLGIREEDRGSDIIFPHSEDVQKIFDLYMRYWQHNGGDPYLPRRYRAILREAGFVNVEITATPSIDGSSAGAAKEWGEIFANHLSEAVFVDKAVEMGLADRDSLGRMAEAVREWGRHPDALWITTHVEAVGWKK